MRLDSVRELKKTIPVLLQRRFASRRAATASAAVAIAASPHRTTASYFLGVAAKGKSYALAVRLQDWALERSALVDEIRARAKGKSTCATSAGSAHGRRGGIARGTGRSGSARRWASCRVRATTLPERSGCFVRKGTSAALYILSNNHVLADENRYGKGKSIVSTGHARRRQLRRCGRQAHRVHSTRLERNHLRRLRHRQVERGDCCGHHDAPGYRPARRQRGGAISTWGTLSTRSGARPACATGR